jgi:hypothetical protein
MQLMLLHSDELTLLGNVAGVGKVLQGLGAGRVLTAAYNAPVLVHQEILLLQTAGGMVRRAVDNLGTGTDALLVGIRLRRGAGRLPRLGGSLARRTLAEATMTIPRDVGHFYS